MKALTLHAPWGYAIAHLGKPVENRSWAPPASIIGKRIAIHQGKKFDEDGFDFIKRICRRTPEMPLIPGRDHHDLGAIVATARVAGWYDERTDRGEPGQHVWPIVEASEWFFGPVGWWLTDVVQLAKPIPCKGAQGLWVVPPDVYEQLPQEAR